MIEINVDLFEPQNRIAIGTLFNIEYIAIHQKFYEQSNENIVTI